MGLHPCFINGCTRTEPQFVVVKEALLSELMCFGLMVVPLLVYSTPVLRKGC